MALYTLGLFLLSMCFSPCFRYFSVLGQHLPLWRWKQMFAVSKSMEVVQNIGVKGRTSVVHFLSLQIAMPNLLYVLYFVMTICFIPLPTFLPDFFFLCASVFLCVQFTLCPQFSFYSFFYEDVFRFTSVYIFRMIFVFSLCALFFTYVH